MPMDSSEAPPSSAMPIMDEAHDSGRRHLQVARVVAEEPES